MPNEKRIVRQLAASVYNAKTKEAELGLLINFAQNIYMDSSLEKTLDEALSEIAQLAPSPGGASTFQYSNTYAELATLINSKSLQPGAQYLLTDYVTKYRQPYTNVIQTADGVGTVERLVLTAVSDSAFNPQCASLDWPNDVVYYDFNDNKCEDGSTPRNGFIQRRIDTKYMVDMPHDWRTMLWARFKATAQTWTSGAVSRGYIYQSSNGLYIATKAGTPSGTADPNYFMLICSTEDYYWSRATALVGLNFNTTDYAERYTFNASDTLTIKTPTKSALIFPERIVVQGGALKTDTNLQGLANNVWMFTIEDNKPSHIFAASGFYSNTLGLYCSGNTFGSSCVNNTLWSYCSGNTFGSGCSNNTFGSGCNYNIFGSYCRGNTFGSNCNSNTFGSSCGGNIFGSDCSGNTFGSGCSGNTFGSYCSGNTFGSSCGNNTVFFRFQYNSLEPYIQSKNMTAISELHNKSYNHRIFINSTGSVYAVHYVGTTPTYTAVA